MWSPTETARLPHAISKHYTALLCCLYAVCLRRHFVIINVALHFWNKELRISVHTPCAVYIYVMHSIFFYIIFILLLLYFYFFQSTR